MKVQCDLCKEIVVADFAVVGDGTIELVCPSCRGRYVVPSTRAQRVTGDHVGSRARRASAAPPLSPDLTMKCPKCAEVQPPAPSCRTCGLQASRMAAYARAEASEVPESVAAAWSDVLATWSDPDAHERLVQALAAHQAYPWGARRYREVLRERPEDQVAADQIARLARMAEATLLAGATRPTRGMSPYRGVSVIMVVLVLALTGGVIYMLFLRKGPVDDAGSGRRTPAIPAAHQPLN